jgi:hypothetical protein
MKRITCPTGCRVRYVPQPGAAPWPPLRPPSSGRVRHLVAWQQPERSEVRGDPVPNRCTTSSPTHRRRHPSGPRHLRRPAPGTSRGETSAAVTAAPARPTRTALRRSAGLPCHPGGRTHNAVLSQVAALSGEAVTPAREAASALSRAVVRPARVVDRHSGRDTPQGPPQARYAPLRGGRPPPGRVGRWRALPRPTAGRPGLTGPSRGRAAS